jgi:hypothetical protein
MERTFTFAAATGTAVLAINVLTSLKNLLDSAALFFLSSSAFTAPETVQLYRIPLRTLRFNIAYIAF